MAVGKITIEIKMKKWAKIPLVATVHLNKLIEKVTGKVGFFDYRVFFSMSGPRD